MAGHYEDIHTGAYDFNGRRRQRKVRAAVHLDASGAVDGFVLFKPGEKYVVKVDEMVDLTPAGPARPLVLPRPGWTRSPR